MLHHIGNRDTRKVVYLATGQDGRQHLMLLRRSQNEQSMMGRFLQCFQKCIESRRTQHMHLIDNKDLVFSDRRRNAHLVDQGTDVIDRVVGGGIEFMDIIRTLLVEGLAGFAFVTGFPVGSRIQTIDRLGKDTGTRSLAHSTGTAKEVGMSQLVTLYCILKCSCQGLLSYHTTKSRRTVFPCRYNIIIHSLLFIDKTKINKIIHYLRENDVLMSRIKEFYIKYLSWINAYWLVTIVFLIVTFTVGDSSLYKRYTYDEKIRGLEKEIKHYQKEIEINSKKLNDLHTDKEGLERFAREEYFMKRSNEDVFIIKDK